jgi:hypothetical protein
MSEGTRRILMSNVAVVFLPNENPGKKPGDYEMFIDLNSAEFPGLLVLEHVGCTAQQIKLYQSTKNPAGKVIPDPQKKADQGLLAGGNYTTVFTSAPLPAGFSFVPGSSASVLLSTGASPGLFEFLVWIKDGSNNDDYLDPGLRIRK